MNREKIFSIQMIYNITSIIGYFFLVAVIIIFIIPDALKTGYGIGYPEGATDAFCVADQNYTDEAYSSCQQGNIEKKCLDKKIAFIYEYGLGFDCKKVIENAN